jgi:hypothetical protein
MRKAYKNLIVISVKKKSLVRLSRMIGDNIKVDMEEIKYKDKIGLI